MAIGFLKKFLGQFQSRPVDWDELEETLIRGDLGVPLSLQLLDRLRELGSEINAQTVEEVTRREITALFPPVLPPLRPHPSRPTLPKSAPSPTPGRTAKPREPRPAAPSRRWSHMT